MNAPVQQTCAAICTLTTPPLPSLIWQEHNARYAGIMAPRVEAQLGWHMLVPEGPEFLLQGVEWGVEWGDEDQLIAGADSRFDGYANTLAMAAAGNALALRVRALPGDCYIPSRAETALMYATMPEHCPKGWCWTSTQYSEDRAWMQYFGYGGQDYGLKSCEGQCRAVRRSVLQSFIPSAAAAQ